MSDGKVLHFTRSAQVKRVLPDPNTTWDAKKTYRLPVILMSFTDCDFAEDHTLEFYQNMFNKKNFNPGKGPGCVADYFRDQSSGQFNLQFDVVGPIKLTSNQKAKTDDNYGMSQIRDAIQKADSQLNYANYDWDGDGRAETVIVVFAGYGGNEDVDEAYGCIWPNTDNLYMKLDGVTVGGFSASQELWTNNTSCGIGTICHEFCHVLGLPDMYPVESNEFSLLDEWDLMDGGNFSDDGWCPPNLSIHEREYLGWQTPSDLTMTTTITNMPPFDRKGVAYRIVNDAYPDEYYLLENRQWEGWDMMLPGHGLLITHVDFNGQYWKANSVNSSARHHCLDYFHADSHDYTYFDPFYGKNQAAYGEGGRNLRMPHTAYPYVDSLGVSHDALTDETTPAATLFNRNADGELLMGKPITQIREQGKFISFKFYASNADGISSVADDPRPVAYYDLQGRLLDKETGRQGDKKTGRRGIIIIKYSDGSTKKIFR